MNEFPISSHIKKKGNHVKKMTKMANSTVGHMALLRQLASFEASTLHLDHYIYIYIIKFTLIITYKYDLRAQILIVILHGATETVF